MQLHVLPPMSENLKNKKHLDVPPKNTELMSIAGDFAPCRKKQKIARSRDTFLGLRSVSTRSVCCAYDVFLKKGVMAHTNMIQFFFRYLFLISILEPTWASTWFTRRDMLWDDSPWLEDPVGVGGTDPGALYEMWNQLTGTEAPPIIPPSTEPPENSPVEEGSQPATPNALEPMLEPSGTKKCSAVKGGAPGDEADEDSADASWGRVEQDPITG